MRLKGVAPYFAIRLDYETALHDQPALATAIAATLTRPCFRALTRLAGRGVNRWTVREPASAERIAASLTCPANDAIGIDSQRGRLLRATMVMENGIGREHSTVRAMRCLAYAALPLVAAEVNDVVAGVCELARLLRATTGFIALDMHCGRAEQVALETPRSTRYRPWLTPQRAYERLGRARNRERLATELASVEWGTFLGPVHLLRVDREQLHRSQAFARVEEISPGLAYLQVSDDPMEDLSGALETKLVAARRELAGVSMTRTPELYVRDGRA